MVTRVRYETEFWSKTNSWILLATIGVELTIHSNAGRRSLGRCMRNAFVVGAPH